MTDFLTFAGAVAAALGNGWSAELLTEHACDRAYLHGPDITLAMVAGDSLSAHVTGHWTPALAEHSHGLRGDSINVSTNRPPEQVARDIKRRFLPIHTRNLTTARIRKSVYDEKNAARQDALTRAAAVLGPLGKVAQLDDGRLIAGDHNDPITVTIRIPLGYPAEVTLRAPQALLPALAQAITNLAQETQ